MVVVKKYFNRLLYFLVLFIFIYVFLIQIPTNVAFGATIYYVRADAAGSNTGLDWANAYTKLPEVLKRDATYYVAASSYYNMNSTDSPLSGAAMTIIKKATIVDHGTEVGWNDSFANGQAIFISSSLNISYGNVIIDGQTGGGPGNWKSNHGFVFTSPAGTRINYINIGSGAKNVIVRHVEFNQTGNTEISTAGGNGVYCPGELYDSLFEYNYFENLGGLPFFFRDGSRNIFQFNYIGNICGMSVADPNEHCEAIVIHGMDDVHFRWNYIGECPSSGGFVKNSSPDSSLIRIYGNVFRNGFPINCNTGSCSDWRIINNTFVDTRGGPFGGDGHVSGLLFYNNIIARGKMSGFWDEHGYNWASMLSSWSCNTHANTTENIIVRYPTNCDDIVESENPFIDLSISLPEYLKLSRELSLWRGIDFCSIESCDEENKYHLDAFGNIRGNDGFWDRGAFEFISSSKWPSPPRGLRIIH